MSHALYHEALVKRARQATGKGRLAQPSVSVRLDNPLCGDRVTLDLELADGSVASVGHEVKGCLLCEAAASTIGELAPGRSRDSLSRAIAGIEAMMQDGQPAPPEFPILDVFAPVHAAKSRRDCVLLAFSALKEALAKA